MPEAPDLLLLSSLRKKKKQPVIKVSSGIGDTDGFPAFDAFSDSYNTPDDRKWGFRITGGADFKMPITVFQVSEYGLAARGGIRLGDIILYINDIDASNLTLAQAHQILNEEESKLHIIAKSMEDDTVGRKGKENEESEEKSVVMRLPKIPKIPDPPKDKAHIKERLQAMQRKLSEIAEISLIIGHILPLDVPNKNNNIGDDDKESGTQDDLSDVDDEDDDDEDEDDDLLSADSLNLIQSKQFTPESDYISDQEENRDDVDEDNDDFIPKLSEEDDKSPTPEPTEEELIKKRKRDKIYQLEQSWPWADRQKPIYRESTCHLVPKLSIVESRIKQLSEGKVMSFYEKKSKNVVR